MLLVQSQAVCPCCRARREKLVALLGVLVQANPRNEVYPAHRGGAQLHAADEAIYLGEVFLLVDGPQGVVIHWGIVGPQRFLIGALPVGSGGGIAAGKIAAAVTGNIEIGWVAQ